jgi:hypothetical protein
VVYLPAKADVTVDLTEAPGKLNVEWMNASTGETAPAAPVEGGGKVTLGCPVDGDAVVRLFGQ